ncbi:hypothetical protein WN093_04615 [Gammaproteobacteria bacterium AS21]
MRKLLFLLAVPMFVYASPSADLITSLKPFSPISTTLENGDLTIVLNQQRITPKIYSAVITTGVCSSIILYDKEALAGIESVSVVNEFSKGYVFEGGKELCLEYGDLPRVQNEVFLLGHTHLK